MNIKEITKEDLKNKYRHHLTIGGLRDFLNKHDLPDNGRVLIQRIEDFYYDNNNWAVYLKESDNTFKDELGNIVKETLEQYSPAWCCVKYNDENEHLLIDLHY